MLWVTIYFCSTIFYLTCLQRATLDYTFCNYNLASRKAQQAKVAEGRWSEKIVSRMRFFGDLVIATPDIYQVTLGPEAEFVLLATDGLWLHYFIQILLSSARMWSTLLQTNFGNMFEMCRQAASEALAQMALDQYSQDNVTIVIADLGRTDWDFFFVSLDPD
ncbi:unnamed protein product [Lactuca virosa]|uniref:PPM-type phosphatase domain-containing protein n=1 Tax=Lactuca virosa TaxID=75947 RepID=A0AAU9MFF8_9ASTR|nr:unnamed protein product [Lactuca virosa]